MEKCQCNQPGFCEFFRQEMTYDPPNWQWCQNATPEERMKYKVACDKKHVRKKLSLGTNFITTAQLMQDCKNLLLPQIGDIKLKGVLGIPRSGMLPASIIALSLSLPLCRMCDSGEIKILSGSTEFGGIRMKDYSPTSGRLLVIDDTIYAGTAINNVKEKIKEEAIYAAVYTHPQSKDKVDFFARELFPPHLLEWNLFNCVYITHALLDFDGIFCPNVPYEKCQSEEDYIDYIKNVKPFYHKIPKTRCKGIVTARLEKYRDITEEWLKRHKIDYGFLKMYPTEKQSARDKNHVVEAANFKAKHFVASDAHFFIESELSEAIIIKKISNKFVVCPESDFHVLQ